MERDPANIGGPVPGGTDVVSSTERTGRAQRANNAIAFRS